ncbi:MAG: hypothetical protein K0R38_6644 [Polyangiaceae bacterium]|jgi:hypothetical protein|nr:hypothetical protein [Polyangiaceae bacterium]
MTTEQTLRTVMAQSINATNLPISAPCALDLERLVRTGALALHANGPPSPTELDLASASLRRLIYEMGYAARSRGAPELQEWSLRDALAQLCPLYPFC